MKQNRDYIICLEDILEAVESAQSFIQNINEKEFWTDKKTQFAVVRAIEIIGEASRKIPNDIKEKYRQIPWREMSDMRNKLIHDYFGVNIEVVWKTVVEDLPGLKKQIEVIIKDNF